MSITDAQLINGTIKAMATWAKNAWKPKRSGDIYCSPACGASCTWAKYQHATKDAKALAKQLGKGWTIRVWENMGWFFQAISPCKRIKVSAPTYYGQRYTAYLGDADECSGGRWVAHGETPIAAVYAAIKKGMDYKKHIDSYLVGFEDYTVGGKA